MFERTLLSQQTYCTKSITVQPGKKGPTTFLTSPSPCPLPFSLCHHDKHLCCHLPSHCRRLHPPCCHHRPKCSSITLHHNAGDHPLHLWARIHHLWQGQQHLHGCDTCSVPATDRYCLVFIWDVTVYAMIFSDIDECELFHNGQAGRLCLHTCVNTPGGYRCTCPVGYNVTRDGRSCKGALL